MSKSILFDGIMVFLTLLFNVYTTITTNNSIIQNRILLYTFFYILLGSSYSLLNRYVLGGNISLLKGGLKFILFIFVTQVISYILYYFKIGAYKFGDWMGFVIFLSYLGYSILLAVISFYVGSIISRQVVK